MSSALGRLLAIAATLVMGCATATRSRSADWLFIESEPPGAAIFVNEVFWGTTPQMVSMPRDHAIKVRCSLAQYRDNTETVYRETASATVFDGPLFAVVDAITGAAYPLQRRRLFLELTPLTASK